MQFRKGLLLLGSYCILESFAGKELGNFGCSNLDLFAGLWIATCAGLTGRYFEAAEADQSYSVTFFERIGNC